MTQNISAAVPIAPPPIPFVRDFDFAYGRADRLTPLIRRVVANNPGPFTFTGTATFIVGDDQGPLAVIDPGPDDAEHLQALLAAIGDQPVSHILVTHTHRDHSPLAASLAAATGATVVAAGPAPVYRSQDGEELDAGQDVDFVPDQTLTDGERIEGAGWTLEAMATPGHASNHLAFALLEENALFSGDHVMGWSTTVVAAPDGDMADYFRSLDRVIAREFRTLWPTHGPQVADPAPFLQAYRAHRLYREAQILAQLHDGPRAISDMVPILYAAVDTRLWPAASLSVEAHLIKLLGEGRVVAQLRPPQPALYRLAQPVG